MKNFIKLFVTSILVVTMNVAHSVPLPDEIVEACGERTCDQIFAKMKRFAKNGSPHAQAVLALMYKGGYSTEVDNGQAVKLMRRAARGGLPFAQHHLAIMYRIGHLVEKDEKESLMWLELAAKNGSKKALDIMYAENRLTPEQKAEYEKNNRKPDLSEGEEVLTVTNDGYTLSDLVDYLTNLGYGNSKQTGSRIKGLGCGKNMSKCVSWQMNTPLGRAEFNNLVTRIGGQQTAIWMSIIQPEGID